MISRTTHQMCAFRTYVAVFFSLGIHGVVWAKQPVECHFQIFKLDLPLADAFQARLLQGEKESVDAMAKMSEMIVNRKAALAAEVRVQALEGKDVRAVSTEKTLTIKSPDPSLEDLIYVDGLEAIVNYAPDTATDVAVMDIDCKYSRKISGDVKTSCLISKLSVKQGRPVLLGRWQDSEEILLLTMTAVFPNLPPGIAGSKLLGHIDMTFHESEADAKANIKPVARIVFPVTYASGISLENAYPKYHDLGALGWENDLMGTSGVANPVSPAPNETRLSIDYRYSKPGKGRERLPCGKRVPAVEYRILKVEDLPLLDNQSRILEMQYHGMADRIPVADLWRAVVKFHSAK